MTAAALANGGANLTLLYVVDIATYFSPVGFAQVTDEDIDLFDARIRVAMGNALAFLSEHCATAATLIVRGKPVHATIRRMARELQADVVLMGTHGRRGISHVLWGSVTEDVLREADLPIIVIRESSTVSNRPLSP